MTDTPPPPPSPEEHSCRNCGDHLTGMYCSTCGQRIPRIPLRIGGIVKDTWGQVVDVDRGFLHTFIGLTTDPGRIVREYVDGRRAAYSPPMRYYLILLAVWFVTPALIGFDYVEYTNQMLDDMLVLMSQQPEFARMTERMRDGLAGMFEYRRWTAVAQPPLFALCCWLVCRTAKRTYAEWLVVGIYTHAHLLLLAMFGFVLLKLDVVILQGVVGLAMYPYLGWALVGFLDDDNIGMSILKALGVFALQVVISGLITCPLIAIVIWL